MTRPTGTPGRRRRGPVALIVVLAAVIVAVVVIGVVSAVSNPRGSTAEGRPTASGPSSSVRDSALPSTNPSQSSRATPGKSPIPRSTPQPTRSVGLTTPATIVRQLTARVTRTTAVQGVAKGPGEVAGPAVRFTVVIRNDTGKAVDLSSTAVNVYYGSSRTPATPFEQPGGEPFPSRVADHAQVTGAFVFSIPDAYRSQVLLTVDTAVRNPVVAFHGSVPRG